MEVTRVNGNVHSRTSHAMMMMMMMILNDGWVAQQTIIRQPVLCSVFN